MRDEGSNEIFRKAVKHRRSQNKMSSRRSREAEVFDSLIRAAEAREDHKAKHGPVKVIMKDGVRLEPEVEAPGRVM